MTRIIGILIFYIFIFCTNNPNSFAQIQCQDDKNKFSVDLRNDHNGNLKNFKTQDQDGLGTCYANALSVALESWTGKPVSYHQLATVYGLSHFGLSSSQAERGRFFTEGGNSCDSFHAIKQSGQKLCLQDDSLFENLITSKDQSKFLKIIGSFYDALNKLDSKKVDEVLLKLENAILNAHFASKSKCEDTSRLEEEARLALGSLVKRIYLSLAQEYEFYLRKKASGEPMLEPDDFFQMCSVQMGLIRKETDKIQSSDIILNDEILENISLVVRNLKKRKDVLKKSSEKNNFFSGLVREVLGPSSPFSTRKLFPELYYNSTFEFNNELVSPLFGLMSKEYCRANIFGSTVQDYLTEKNLCSQEVDSNISTFFYNINLLFSDNLSSPDLNYNFFDQLQNSGKNFKSFFLGFFDRSCSRNGIKIPEDLNCHLHLLPMRLNFFEQLAFLSPSKKEETEKKRTLDFLNKKISDELLAVNKESENKGRAVMVSVCAGFFKTKDMNYNWPKNDRDKKCKVVDFDNFHEMAIIGMRCHKGSVQYKIQNSWGNQCPFKFEEGKREFCEANDGTFWLDEKILADNVRAISVLTRDQAHQRQSF